MLSDHCSLCNLQPSVERKAQSNKQIMILGLAACEVASACLNARQKEGPFVQIKEASHSLRPGMAAALPDGRSTRTGIPSLRR